MEFNENNDDWSIEVYYGDIARTVNVDVPDDLLGNLSVGQKMSFLIKDENYTSEWAGLHGSAFEHYQSSCLRTYLILEAKGLIPEEPVIQDVVESPVENTDNEGFVVQ